MNSKESWFGGYPWRAIFLIGSQTSLKLSTKEKCRQTWPISTLWFYHARRYCVTSLFIFWTQTQNFLSRISVQDVRVSLSAHFWPWISSSESFEQSFLFDWKEPVGWIRQSKKGVEQAVRLEPDNAGRLLKIRVHRDGTLNFWRKRFFFRHICIKFTLNRFFLSNRNRAEKKGETYW